MVVQPHAAAGDLGGLLYRPALLGHQLPTGAGFRVLTVGLRPGRVRRGEQVYLLPRFAPKTSQAFNAVSFQWNPASSRTHAVTQQPTRLNGMGAMQAAARREVVLVPAQIVIASVIEDRIQRRYYLVPFSARVKRPAGQTLQHSQHANIESTRMHALCDSTEIRIHPQPF